MFSHSDTTIYHACELGIQQKRSNQSDKRERLGRTKNLSKIPQNSFHSANRSEFLHNVLQFSPCRHRQKKKLHNRLNMKQNDKRNAHIPQFPAHPHSSIPAVITAHRRRTATKISGTHNDIISRQTLVHSPERIRAANKRLPPYSTTPLVRPNTRALFFCWFLRL